MQLSIIDACLLRFTSSHLSAFMCQLRCYLPVKGLHTMVNAEKAMSNTQGSPKSNGSLACRHRCQLRWWFFHGFIQTRRDSYRRSHSILVLIYEDGAAAGGSAIHVADWTICRWPRGWPGILNWSWWADEQQVSRGTRCVRWVEGITGGTNETNRESQLWQIQSLPMHHHVDGKSG